MALGESQMFCIDCNRPVLAALAGMARTPHCPQCGRRFTMKDNFKHAARMAEWKRGR